MMMHRAESESDKRSRAPEDAGAQSFSFPYLSALRLSDHRLSIQSTRSRGLRAWAWDCLLGMHGP